MSDEQQTDDKVDDAVNKAQASTDTEQKSESATQQAEAVSNEQAASEQQTDESKQDKFAGKTAEDIKAMYENLEKLLGRQGKLTDKEVTETQQELADLKQQYAELKAQNSVPEDYDKPNTNLGDETIAHFKQIAKESGLTQHQFNKMVERMEVNKKAQQEQAREQFINANKESIEQVDKYLANNYPDSVAKRLQNAIRDDSQSLEHFKNERQKFAGGSVKPGNTLGVSGGQADFQSAIKDAKERVENNPFDSKAKEELIQLYEQRAQSRRKQ